MEEDVSNNTLDRWVPVRLVVLHRSGLTKCKWLG